MIPVCAIFSQVCNALTTYLSNMSFPLFCTMVKAKCFPVKLKPLLSPLHALFINTLPTLNTLQIAE